MGTVNPFDILSGQVVFTEYATFHFSGPGDWFVNGVPLWEQLNRLDGPAVEWANGSKSWYVNGQLHRTDGPAVEWADGSKSWYLSGRLFTETEVRWQVRAVDNTVSSTTIGHE